MQGMQGMNMGEVALSSMPSFPASSGMAWQPGLGPRDDVDDFTRRLGVDASLHCVYYLQPAGWATRRR
jgi:hypothetical protein